MIGGPLAERFEGRDGRGRFWGGRVGPVGGTAAEAGMASWRSIIVGARKMWRRCRLMGMMAGRPERQVRKQIPGRKKRSHYLLHTGLPMYMSSAAFARVVMRLALCEHAHYRMRFSAYLV